MKRVKLKIKQLKHLLNINSDGIKYLLSEGSINPHKPFTVVEYQRLKIKNDLLRDIHGV
tara:strand:+ start:210 stop:386 length:177 start_codon:yes stop_codon:yes gene_type:complete